DLCHRLVEDRHYVLERPVGNGGAVEHSVEPELGVDRREVREFDDALGFLDLQVPAVDDLRDMGEETGDAERAGRRGASRLRVGMAQGPPPALRAPAGPEAEGPVGL